MSCEIPGKNKCKKKYLNDPLSIKQRLLFGGFLMLAGFFYFNDDYPAAVKTPVALILALSGLSLGLWCRKQ